MSLNSPDRSSMDPRHLSQLGLTYQRLQTHHRQHKPDKPAALPLLIPGLPLLEIQDISKFHRPVNAIKVNKTIPIRSMLRFGSASFLILAIFKRNTRAFC